MTDRNEPTYRAPEGTRRRVEYPFERVIVQEPEPVTEQDRDYGKAWFGFSLFCGVAIAALVIGFRHAAPRTVETWPPDGPSSVFGMTTPPEPVACPSCDCGATWLARFVHTLDTLSATPLEVRDVLARAYTETRYTPSVVSDTGDYGICQINAASWPEYDAMRLLDDPEYAAAACLDVYRVYRAKCGDAWQCCYRRGVLGCRARSGK